MSEPLQSGDMLAGLGRHWGWVLSYGVLTVIAAIAVLAWPEVTLIVIAVLFGIQLVVFGVYRFIQAFATDMPGGGRVLYALLGVLSLIVGLWALRHADVTLLILALLLGIFWIVNGVMEIFTAAAAEGVTGRGWAMAMGVLSCIAGIIVLAYPKISLLTLAVIMGIWLLIFGLMEIVAAFRLRAVRQAPSPDFVHAH